MEKNNKWRIIWLITFAGFLVFLFLFLLKSFDGEAAYWRNYAKDLQEANIKQENQLKNYKSQISATQNVKQQVKNLKSQLSSSQKEVEKLLKKIKKLESTSQNSKENTANYDKNDILSLLFWKADVPYVMKDESFKFYSDFSCDDKSEISEKLTFVNYFDYEVVDPNDDNNYVYLSMSVEKGPVWSKTRPYFYKQDQ